MIKSDQLEQDFLGRIEKAAKLIKNSKYLVIFTGAGISTESGIPDYRGPNGVWTRRDKGLPPPKWKVAPEKVVPNVGHEVIFKLYEKGFMKFLISQNVDNLHLTSGIPEEKIAEFHGNKDLMKCLNCNKKFKKPQVWDESKWGKGYLTSRIVKGQPQCPDCSGRLVSSVVNFGDPIPEPEYTNSIFHSKKSDVFLVVGSSISVSPASYMPQYALRKKSKLIIINMQETPFDSKAEIIFREPAGKTLQGILNHLETNIE